MTSHPFHKKNTRLVLDDDDDDDDDLIVYGDHQSQKMSPQHVAAGTQQTLDSSAVVSSRNPHGDNHESKFHGMLSRQERRKRRQEWKERDHHPTEEATLSPSFPHDNDDDRNDTFASLQAALLQELSASSCSSQSASLSTKKRSSPRMAPANDDDDTTTSPTKIPPTLPTGLGSSPQPQQPRRRRQDNLVGKSTSDDQDESLADSHADHSSNVPITPHEGTVLVDRRQPTIATTELEQQPSPPDFTYCNDDFHDDDENDQEETVPVESRYKEKANKHDKNKKKRSSLPAPARHLDTSPHAQPSKRRRQHSMPIATTNSKHKVRATQIVPTEKTIVGMRPSHWDRPARPSLSQTQQQQQLARRKLLRAGTLQSSNSSSQVNKGSSKLCSKDLVAMVRKENVSNISNHTPRHEKSGMPSNITAKVLRTMNFRPSTMPKARKTTMLSSNQIEGDDDDDTEGRAGGTPYGPSTNMSSSMLLDRSSFSPHASSSAPRRSHQHCSSKKGSKLGPWSERLAMLQSHQSSNAMKLQHAGLNRFGVVCLDVNDPRKKAQSYTDLTILDTQQDTTSSGGGVKSMIGTTNEASSSSQLVWTLPCFLHQHAATSDSGLGGDAVQNVLAWFSITPTTARNVGLQKGVVLRVYDAILLPLLVSGDEPNHEDKLESRFLVICTQVCERLHPEKVNPVPDSIAKIFEAKSKD